MAPTATEADVRQGLIDKLFGVLGWDVANKQQAAPQYRDVILEPSTSIEGRRHAPDYAFRIGSTTVFFVEAKKCVVPIHRDAEAAIQLRRYGWHQGIAISILTNFEYFAVYDCRGEPKRTDRVGTRRLLLLHWEEYLGRWDEVSSLFAYSSVRGGRLDEYVVGPRKRGSVPVDVAFLGRMEEWRNELAKGFASGDRSLSAESLTHAVQMTLDRLVFLRIAEDRRMEPFARLLHLTQKPGIYARFIAEVCKAADEKYNSGLFHFRRSPDFATEPDRLTPKLEIDDRVMRSVIQSMYSEHGCDYDFSLIPVDILGTVYERFLGRTIRLTAGHAVKIDEPPERRKAGGVFYTPSFVVRYIVQQALLPKLDKKSPAQLRGRNGVGTLRVLDMACGSGSFLLAAYECLLSHCLEWYRARNPDRFRGAVIRHPRAGTWQLTISEKKRILLDHIYGVDIDAQAVEVAKLSLMLKALEGEDEDTYQSQMQLFQERALPDLASNIRCGNSLVEADAFSLEVVPRTEDIAALRPFDWTKNFPAAMRDGGFDCILGNPPYIPTELMSDAERRYFISSFSYLTGKYEESVLFISRGIEKLKRSGVLGFVSTTTWQTGENYREFRRRYLGRRLLRLCLNLPHDVFEDAYVDTAIYIFGKVPADEFKYAVLPKRAPLSSLAGVQYDSRPYASLDATSFRLSINSLAAQLMERLCKQPRFQPLGEVTKSTQGLALSRYNLMHKASGSDCLPIMTGGTVSRYSISIESSAFASLSDGSSGREFYTAAEKLIVRRIVSRSNRIMVAHYNKAMIFKKDFNPFVPTSLVIPIHSLLAILNSKLISFLYLGNSAVSQRDDFRQTTLAELRRLPVPRNSGAIVQALAQAGKALIQAYKDPQHPGHEASTLEERVDRLVYELYGLSPAETAAVEAFFGMAAPDR